MNSRVRQLIRWFWIAGCIGVAVAIGLYVLGSFHYTRRLAVRAAYLLCPEMILGLAEPNSPEAIFLLLAWVLGTNFLLYGIIGVLLNILVVTGSDHNSRR